MMRLSFKIQAGLAELRDVAACVVGSQGEQNFLIWLLDIGLGLSRFSVSPIFVFNPFWPSSEECLPTISHTACYDACDLSFCFVSPLSSCFFLERGLLWRV